MSVLDTIKGKIVNVQQDISESFRSLKITTSRSKSLDDITPVFSNNASIEQLSRYQKSWALMHRTSEDLAQRAQAVDGLIGNLFHYMDQQSTALNRFTSEMASLTLLSDINVVKDKIKGLEGAFAEVETLLLELENVNNRHEFMRKKAEHESQLTRYRQNKHVELEQVKVGLAKQHAAKVQKYEELLSATLIERQKVFEEAHREQMLKYITTGQVDSFPPSPIHSSNLADIEIEPDRTELDQFLSSIEETEPSRNEISVETSTSCADEDEDGDTDAAGQCLVLQDEDLSFASKSNDTVPSVLLEAGDSSVSCDSSASLTAVEGLSSRVPGRDVETSRENCSSAETE